MVYIIKQVQCYMKRNGEKSTYEYYWLCKNERVPHKPYPVRRKLLYLGKKKPTIEAAIQHYEQKTGVTLSPDDFEIKEILTEDRRKITVEDV